VDAHVTALFGLPGFEVLTAVEVDGALELLVQTPQELTGCPQCGAVATVKDRRPVWVRDLPIGGRPVVVCWHKRVWCCPHALCLNKSWTEDSNQIQARAALTERARAWAFGQVAHHDAAVSRVAAALGVGWATIMRIVVARGAQIVDDPDRLAGVSAIGVDETSFLRATGEHSTLYATGIADLTPGRCARLLDVVPGRSGGVLGGWLGQRAERWRTGIRTASLDPFRGYATALKTQLPQAVRVLDPFHVVRLGLTCVDQVRRRVQQDTLAHRGLAGDPLFTVRRLLRRRADRLSTTQTVRLEAALAAGDPRGEVTAAWSIAQHLMAAYTQTDPATAKNAVDTLIKAAKTSPIGEIARLGRTLGAWRTELHAHFDHPTVSNGPTENLNLKIKNSKRVARGYRNFGNYRLRLLLNHGDIRQDQQPLRIRTRKPRNVA
jgi:transposase